MNKASVVLLIFLLGMTTIGEVGAVNEAAMNFLKFLIKFYEKPVVSLVRNSSATEDPAGQDFVKLKREKLPAPTVTPIFQTTTINIPINAYMSNVMFQMFGKGGILERGGFSRTGFIHRNASASIILLGSFGNRTLFLHEILRAHHSPIADSVLALVVQLFFTPDDFQRLTQWLTQEVSSGYVNYDEPCSPIVKITFTCCTKISNPYLQPKFGTLRVDID
ncbi:uncharacterized protein LOC114959583 [Acropora millepora]|uniref:uncharacterized protein LOC114959583 n=1 Tax=Acropora millepora TaxID=45264 RepID=UPI001CF29356|nr:uncharacterized protein LOC114959583 [Acropora millepora]